jgi:hypothetical protein
MMVVVDCVTPDLERECRDEHPSECDCALDFCATRGSPRVSCLDQQAKETQCELSGPGRNKPDLGEDQMRAVLLVSVV